MFNQLLLRPHQLTTTTTATAATTTTAAAAAAAATSATQSHQHRPRAYFGPHQLRVLTL